MDRPLGLLAELTYRCPLHCPYCSNPVAVPDAAELALPEWCRVLAEARALGVLQVHLTGGEPLTRPDLTPLVARARDLGFYVSLVTSGVGLDERRTSELAHAGLDHVQLSMQDADRMAADETAGARVFDRKMAAAHAVTALELPLTINVVLHRGNIGRIGPIVDLAAALGADRLELAHAQYYGWGLLNRSALLPTRDQVAAAEQALARARAAYGDTLEILYVVADYHEPYPKPCMHGWGRRHIVIAPDGWALPCPAAAQIIGLGIDNVRERSLSAIWRHSPAFTRFRGYEWMSEPCRGCPRKKIDFGGCRCQAFQLTGDAARADPVCRLSPDHHLLDAALQVTGPPRPRVNPQVR
ncbi:MAG: pyrroloquinoline quinone biosynthesis protein PqqE [Pseudonocardiales bacterium]|nr:pyrroloquinoline quinone biosynthesis protein PqqE [Pseudonocardiales bacterium]MBV9032107.1 pyrroloquinoline quinone biosynthesis protein PqqE [Pseudonocardiales bacterium]MBW0011263.1 pyrroloquinoline quinone biosynthesis protein PqqE [Pseudonocardiales bacterium]